MPKPPGFTIYANSTEVKRDTAEDADIEAGDPVTANDDEEVEVAGEGDDLTGVAGNDTLREDNERVVIDGAVIASVAPDTPAGVDLAPGADGLEEGDGSAHSLSEEGGEYKGADIEDGFAAVSVN
ncbi:hypothetical protein [Natronococcus roseus]|uniref:hypothetical protein n=1 Tax=Natronococcus roseus TaxID=1052014 RepID=UPI00374D136D